jgi:hypothetical protein
MATIADIRPGAPIFSIATGGRGTLTCFALRHDTPHALYGVTARHVLVPGSYCEVGSGTVVGETTITLGGPAIHSTTGDLLYFPIDDAVRPQLTQNNFIPVGSSAEPTHVWDPTKFRTRMAAATKATVADAYKAKTKDANIIGGVSGAVPADFGKHSRILSNTAIARGDSGGCVLDSTRLRYIGLVSSGYEEQISNKGTSVVLFDQFASNGLTLATWADRDRWL